MLMQRLHHKKSHFRTRDPDRRSSACSCVQPRYPGTADPLRSLPCTTHPVRGGLYKNVYTSNVISHIKYFVVGENAVAALNQLESKEYERG